MVALIAVEVSSTLAPRETSGYGLPHNPFKKSNH